MSKSICYCEIAYLDSYYNFDTPPNREPNKKCSIIMFSYSKIFVQLIEQVCELYAEVFVRVVKLAALTRLGTLNSTIAPSGLITCQKVIVIAKSLIWIHIIILT